MKPQTRSGRSGLALSIALLGLAGIALAGGSARLAASPRRAPPPPARARQDPALGPGLLPVDAFHPDRRPRPTGRCRRCPSRPTAAARSSTWTCCRAACADDRQRNVTRRILYEVHETLSRRDWETTEWTPDLALRFDVQDRLVLKPGARQVPEELLVGAVIDHGKEYVVDPKPGYVVPTRRSCRSRTSPASSAARS
jgi:hypothetical protein